MLDERLESRGAHVSSASASTIEKTVFGPRASEGSDEAIVARVLGGETELYEILMRRHNQRLYRIARSILRNDAEAEDVMQDAYVRAYAHLGQFERRASFATWLGRIAVNEALARVRRRGRYVEWDETMDRNGLPNNHSTQPLLTPEDELGRQELRSLLTDAIDNLPTPHRLVFVLRHVEGMTTGEVAECLGISEDNVKARLHRARTTLREDIERRVGRHAPELFSFHLSRCDRVVRNVFSRLPLVRKS